MIRVTVDLLPGGDTDPERRQEVGRLDIWRQHADTPDRSSYAYSGFSGRTVSFSGRDVSHWRDEDVFKLIARVLAARRARDQAFGKDE